MATGRIGTTPVLTTRWSKAPSAGTTSLSGLDDNSVSLVYSVGYEAVYQNGVLLSRGNDYTATNGTTITLTTATVAGDIIEVFANQTIPLTDTYSQTVSDGRFIKNTLTTTTGDIIYASAANTPARLGIGSTDQVLKVSGGVPVWGAVPTSTPSFVGCSVYKSGAQTISTATTTVITWDSEDFDTDSFHDNSTNNGRFTIPTGKGGKYLISSFLYLDHYLGSSVNFSVDIVKNGNLIWSLMAPFKTAYENQGVQASSIISLVAGDYVDLRIYQASGNNASITGGLYNSRAQIAYLGA